MNANSAVEQSAALIVCSAASGRRRWACPATAGCSRGRPHRRTTRTPCRTAATCTPRRRHPAAARELLALAGTGVDELAHVDLYSCFPSAVEVAAAEIGLGLDRQLTVTGGLSFAGGPWNNYVHPLRSPPWRECSGRTPGASGS